MATEKQLMEIKSLLLFYFASLLDASIESAESENNYSATVYESWLSRIIFPVAILLPNENCN